MPRSFISNDSRPHLILAGDVVDILRGTGLLSSGDSVVRKALSVGSMEAGVFMENIGASEDQYPNTAMVSLDAIFSPYSVISHTRLPSFSTPTDLSGPNALTLNPWNPNNSIPTGTHFAQWMNSGHNITMAAVGSGLGSGETEDFIFEKDFFGRRKVETSHIRGIGLRSPVILTGWGFDTAGKPVPADPDDPDKFHPSGFWEPSLWPAGPIDLRWNTAKGVWVAGTSAATIRFSIYETNCEMCAAVGEVLSRPPGVAAVEGEYTIPEVMDDTRKFVDLTDKTGDKLNEPNHILVGRLGHATYLTGPAKCLYQEETSWEITSLAEQQTECEI